MLGFLIVRLCVDVAMFCSVQTMKSWWDLGCSWLLVKYRCPLLNIMTFELFLIELNRNIAFTPEGGLIGGAKY